MLDNNTAKSLVFVSSAIQHPRHQKRIKSLSAEYRVFVIYNERPQYADNIAAFDHPHKLTQNLGLVENTKHHKRFGLLIKLWRALRKRQEDIVYCTSTESAVVAALLGKKVVFELGDLHHYGPLKVVYQLIDRWLIPRLSLLVLTSPDFINKYYALQHPNSVSRMVVIENKLPSTMQTQVQAYRAAQSDKRPNLQPVKLGLIGSIRFPRMLLALRELVEQRNDVELHIYGDGEVQLFEGLQRCVYHGTFKNPSGLEAIYSAIDVTVILYDNDDLNVRWALPNKLYESIAFQRPILCSNRCCLADTVEENGYGVASSVSNLSDNLNRLLNNYDEFQARLIASPPSAYLDDDQHIVRLLNNMQ